MSIQANIIWLEQIINSENFQYIKELSDLGFTKTKIVKSISEVLKELKKIKFEDTIIIIDINLYYQFIKEFIKNLVNIYTIPIIIIFNKLNQKINLNLKQDSDIANNPYYHYGGIKTSFNDINNYIINPKNKDSFSQKIDEGNFVFEYIDCKE